MCSLKKRPERSCRLCLNIFQATHHLQEYCSKKCYTKAREARNAARNRAKNPQDIKGTREYIKDEDIHVPEYFLVRGTPGTGKIYLEGVDFGSTS